MVFQDRIQITTRGHRQMHDITAQVADVVARSRIRAGTVQVFNVGSTGAIGTIEYEPGLERDLPELLDRLIPPSPDYGHEQYSVECRLTRIIHVGETGSPKPSPELHKRSVDNCQCVLLTAFSGRRPFRQNKAFDGSGLQTRE